MKQVKLKSTEKTEDDGNKTAKIKDIELNEPI